MDTETRNLLERARRGDRVAFDRLALLRRDRIARLAWRLMAWSSHDVDDVVQEVLMDARRTLDRLRDDDQLDGWLFGITANRCRAWRRAWFRRRRRDTLAAASSGGAEPAGEAVAESDRAVGAAVRAAVARLSAREREVVVLRYVEDLPPDAIARSLGISRGAVDVRLHRARTRLTEMLQTRGTLAHE